MLKMDVIRSGENAAHVAGGASAVSVDIPFEQHVDSAPPETDTVLPDALIHASTVQAKVGYFAMYIGLSSSPYYGLLLEGKGFSPFVVGVIMAFMPLCTLVLLPPLSFVADRYRCSFTVHIYAAAGSALFLTLATLFRSHFIIAFTMVLHFAFRTPVGPFMDQLAMSILPSDRKVQWGSIRSFGAYGWAVGAFLNSLVNGGGEWWTFGLTYALGMCVAMYTVCNIVPHDEPQSTRMNYTGVLRYVVSHRRLLLFLSALCFMGMGYSLINTFLFIFLDSINAPSVLLGISVVMTVVVEIPLFRCSELIHRYATDRQLMCVSMWAWVVRVMGYSFLRNPWMVLFLEPLHGLTFGLMWLSGIHFVRRAFPNSLSHSSMGFLSATAFGVGPLMGNIVGGTLVELLGNRWMFRIIAFFMLCISIVFAVLDRFLERLGYMDEAVEDVCLEDIPPLVAIPSPALRSASALAVDERTVTPQEQMKDDLENVSFNNDEVIVVSN